MNVYIVCYADDVFADRQNLLVEHCKSCEDLGGVFTYNRENLVNTEFYEEHKQILDLKRGGGYWLWKPFFILDALKQIKNDDVIFYIDCGDVFKCEVINLIKQQMQDNSIFLFEGAHANKYWTKRDCFAFMDCDKEQYWSTIQLEAGVCFFKKTDFSISFLKEWIKYASDSRVVTDEANVSGLDNFPGFQDHRHDQSILTNLSVKYNVSRNKGVSSGFRNFIKCNVQ